MSKYRPPKLRLLICDRGEKRGLFDLRDVFLVEGDCGQSTWLRSLGIIAGHADEIALWAESLGYEVKRTDPNNIEVPK